MQEQQDIQQDQYNYSKQHSLDKKVIKKAEIYISAFLFYNNEKELCMENVYKKKIILASASPRRQEILKNLISDFEIIPSPYIEIIIFEKSL